MKKQLTASEMGRKGGASKSEAKKLASRLNGQKGGYHAHKKHETNYQ